MTLYFAEYTATAVDQRVFDVSINGVRVVTDVDIYAITGGQDRALSLPYNFYSGVRSNFDISLPTTVNTVISPADPSLREAKLID